MFLVKISSNPRHDNSNEPSMPYRRRIFFWKKMDHNPLSLLPVVSRMKFTIKKYFGGRNESWILISLKCSSKCTLPTWDESPLSSSTIGARLLQFSVFSKSKQIQRCIKIAHWSSDKCGFLVFCTYVLNANHLFKLIVCVISNV